MDGRLMDDWWMDGQTGRWTAQPKLGGPSIFWKPGFAAASLQAQVSGAWGCVPGRSLEFQAVKCDWSGTRTGAGSLLLMKTFISTV